MDKKKFAERSLELCKQYLTTHIEETEGIVKERVYIMEDGGRWTLKKNVFPRTIHQLPLVEFHASFMHTYGHKSQNVFIYPSENWKVDFSNC